MLVHFLDNSQENKIPDSGILFLKFIDKRGWEIDEFERKFNFFAKNFFNRIFVREKILVLQKNSIFFQNRAKNRYLKSFFESKIANFAQSCPLF